MFNRVSPLLYSIRDIDGVTNIRTDSWQSLVSEIINSELDSVERTAFVLFMSRLSNCHQCHSDSYKALHGCKDCGKYTIKRYQGDDYELLDLFIQAKEDVIEYKMEQNTQKTI